MGEERPIINTGLRGITIASTKISDVNGREGKLIYRGYLVGDIAGKVSFEEVTHLLLKEYFPGKSELEAFQSELTAERSVSPSLIEALKTRPSNSLPMDILQAGAAMLANEDPDVENTDLESAVRKAKRLVAKFPTLLAAWHRIRNGKDPIQPSDSLGHAANFLYMMTGEIPDEEISRFFDTCLVLHAEHSFNASTFAAREVASTRAHMYASIAAAVGSLSGALHGGANTRVMRMLMEIGSVDRVEQYIDDQLSAGKKVMGLGHAVYKVDDPRALILAPMAKTMCERIGEPKWYEISKELEIKAKAAFKKRKNMDIFVNVDFYSASLYYAMGIPIDFFTPVFAISRVSGWTAHVIEEQYGGADTKPTLYRPESDYIGNYCGPDVCTLEPLEDR